MIFKVPSNPTHSMILLPWSELGVGAWVAFERHQSTHYLHQDTWMCSAPEIPEEMVQPEFTGLYFINK